MRTGWTWAACSLAGGQRWGTRPDQSHRGTVAGRGPRPVCGASPPQHPGQASAAPQGPGGDQAGLLAGAGRGDRSAGRRAAAAHAGDEAGTGVSQCRRLPGRGSAGPVRASEILPAPAPAVPVLELTGAVLGGGPPTHEGDWALPGRDELSQPVLGGARRIHRRRARAWSDRPGVPRSYAAQKGPRLSPPSGGQGRVRWSDRGSSAAIFTAVLVRDLEGTPQLRHASRLSTSPRGKNARAPQGENAMGAG